MQSLREIRSLTGLRGFAAIYVVAGHYIGVGANPSNPLRIFLSHSYLAVDLFFILSGFVMALNYGHLFSEGWSFSNYFRFLGRRIARIYPLFLVATITGFWLRFAGIFEAPTMMPLGTALFFNLLMIQAWGFAPSLDGPAWSISAEWAAYLLFPVLLIPSIARRSPISVFTGLLCIGAVVGLCILSVSHVPTKEISYATFGLNIWSYEYGLPVLRCLPEFVLGTIVFRFTAGHTKGSVRSRRWLDSALTVLLIALLFVRQSDIFVVLIFVAYIAVLATGGGFVGRFLGSPPAELLGKLSYSIYLLHSLMTPIVVWLHARVNASGRSHGQTVAAIITIALVFVAAWIAYNFIELPSRRALRRLFDNAPGAKVSSPAVQTRTGS